MQFLIISIVATATFIALVYIAIYFDLDKKLF